MSETNLRARDNANHLMSRPFRIGEKFVLFDVGFGGPLKIPIQNIIACAYIKDGTIVSRFTIEEIPEDICECYPEHCLVEKHGECWCSPTIEIINGSRLTTHNERH